MTEEHKIESVEDRCRRLDAEAIVIWDQAKSVSPDNLEAAGLVLAFEVAVAREDKQNG